MVDEPDAVHIILVSGGLPNNQSEYYKSHLALTSAPSLLDLEAIQSSPIECCALCRFFSTSEHLALCSSAQESNAYDMYSSR